MGLYERVTWALCGVSAVALLGGCADASSAAAKPRAGFVLDKAEGTEIARLRLEPGVAERLELKLAQVATLRTQGAGVGSLAVPYPALLYKTDGSTFVYTNPEPNVYLHQSVKVQRIDGEIAVVSEGPDAGTSVVTDGAAELMGMEFGVGK